MKKKSPKEFSLELITYGIRCSVCGKELGLFTLEKGKFRDIYQDAPRDLLKKCLKHEEGCKNK